MQKYNPLRKGTAVVILVLFIGMSIIPSTVGVDKSSMSTFNVPTIVSIQPSSVIVVEPGETFNVSVYVEPSEPIIGIEIGSLHYNASVVHANSVTEGDLFDEYNVFNDGSIDNVNGIISTVYLIAFDDPVSDPGSFVDIEFTVQEVGYSVLDLEDVLILNTSEELIPVEVHDGEVIPPPDYTLNIMTNGLGTTIPASGAHIYPFNTIVDVEAFPDIIINGISGFAGWTGDVLPGHEDDNPVTIVMDDNKNITAQFWSLEISTIGCGWVDIIPPSSGTTVTLTATPCSNWAFFGWSGDISGTQNPISILIYSDMSITANFVYTLPIYINGCGSVTKNPDYSSYPVGSTVQLTAEPCPGPGWSFSHWSGDISGTENPTNITINENMNTGITANFESTTTMSILPSSQTVARGETFEVSVWVYPNQPINGISFGTLYFNATLIHANSVNFDGFFYPYDTLFSMWPEIDNVNGEIRDVFEGIMGVEGVSSNGSWVTISFTAQNVDGVSLLELDGVCITKEGPIVIPCDINNGNVTVTNPPDITDVTLIHSIPKDTVIGWENISCTVTDDGTLDVVQINFTCNCWPWGDTEYFNVPMSNVGNIYYYNTTLSRCCRCCEAYYEYHIWAVDNDGNQDSTLPETFSLPSNADINCDGSVGFVDIMSVAGLWGVTGPQGWIRADINNDGSVGFLDIMGIAGCYWM